MAKENPSTFALALGLRLKAARGERSYQDVANATGGYVHPRMLHNYESGTEPRYSTLLVLAAALGCRLSDLIPADVLRASERKDADRLVSHFAE